MTVKINNWYWHLASQFLTCWTTEVRFSSLALLTLLKGLLLWRDHCRRPLRVTLAIPAEPAPPPGAVPRWPPSPPPPPFQPQSESPPSSPSPSNGFAPSLEQIETLRAHCRLRDRRLRSRGRLSSSSSATLPNSRRSGASLPGGRRLWPLSATPAGFAPSPSRFEATRRRQGGRRPPSRQSSRPVSADAADFAPSPS
jgi:hypothetical protein